MNRGLFISLDELAEISTGFPFDSSKYDQNEGIVVIRGENISEGNLRWDTTKRWNFDYDPKYLLKEKDIVIGMDGSKVGKNKAIINNNDLPLILAQRVACVRSKENSVAEFLYYCFKWDGFETYINRIKTGSSIPHISQEQLREFFIPNIEFNKQQRIANVLSALDQKIDLNNKIISELEQMAKELYDYWFVQFDFPDADGKPYRTSGGKMTYDPTLKREIPDGWIVGNINKVARIGSGGTPSKSDEKYWNGNIPFFGPTDYRGNAIQFHTQEHITEEGLNGCSSELYKKGDIIITARGSIGKRIIVGTPMAMNQSCYAIVPLWDCYEYIYILSEYLIEALKLKGSGSVFKSIVTSDIEHTLLCIAPKEQIYLFVKQIRSSFNTIANRITENQELSSLRDWLLPMLMNGQVTVGESADKAKKSKQAPIINLASSQDQRFDLWVKSQGLAARGDIDKTTLREIFNAMDDDDK